MSRAHSTMSDRSGFWAVAAVFTAVTAYATVPTPLYPLYQAADDFPVPVVTLIFSAFAVGVVFSLFLIGHISDWAGRRRMAIVAVLASAAAAVVFILWSSVPGLITARFIDGVSVGTLTAAATAHLAELRARARPGETAIIAASVAGAANLGGLALGPLIGGLFAEFLPDPLELPHIVFLVLFLVAAAVLRAVPETVDLSATHPAYRPQRLAFPPGSRTAFAAAGVGAAASFALFALFTSLTPTFLHETFHVSDHLVDGATVFAIFGAAATAQLVFVRVAQRTQLAIAIACFIAGLALISAGAVAPALAVFIIGGIVAGAGAGIMFRSAIAGAGELAAHGQRGETLALLFLIAYGGLVVPVLLVGWSLTFADETTVLLVFAAVVLVATLGAGVAMRRQLPAARPQSRDSTR
ncbi:MFS transporter [Microbacterium sp. QXD-8]|uniref:MFS transporter n=1 Tax=Microbacterium psychrotolerans TaxID=3068321 RepID=A0ABU0YWA0_9MICO|nr:MFS transporter [Microbacterium sp. QXD-8]MDQ7876612.1 MFS transporter [Microbacterium sp. QXD-8]